MSRFWLFYCISAAALCLVTDAGILRGREGWYSTPVRRADWRGVRAVDLSTNPIVSRYYSGRKSVAFRNDNRASVEAALAGGDTLHIGLDYYMLSDVCNNLLPRKLVLEYVQVLDRGRVVVVRALQRGRDVVYMPADPP